MSRKKKKTRKQKLSFSKKKSIQRKSPSSRFPFDISGEMHKASQYLQSGHLQRAERIYKRILSIVPNHSECLYLLGITSHQLGKTDTAVHLINKAIVNDPKNPAYHNNLGIVFQVQGKIDEAISCYQKALELKPDFAEAYNNMGNVLKDQGKIDEAISCYQKALELGPDDAEVYYNMGIVFQVQSKIDEAISCYQKALELRPDFAEAYNNMGNVLKDHGKIDEAISCYQKALELRPGDVEAYNHMGNVFQDQSKFDQAISCYKKALQLKPDYAEASYNMGVVFQRQHKLNESISCYRKAIQLKPDYAKAYANLVRQIEMTCAWQKLQGLTEKIDDMTKKALDNRTKPAEHPFINVTRYADLSRNFAIAKSWSSDITRRVSSLKIHFSFDDKRSCKTRIAVGYLSNDFQNHATAHLMLSLFGLHNRDEFDIFCYSYGQDDESYYRKRIRRDCDKFVDLRDLRDADAARCIYEDQVDILIDLKAYAGDNRLAICALRPAPIQVSYLGFPGTTGAEFFDYIITDKIVTPKDHACYFSENFVYLPHCYQVNDYGQSISNKDWKKVRFGLPEAGFVFCSFNQAYKIDRVIFEAWMQILRQVPESILWLQPGNETAERNLRREAEERGVGPERLIFGEWLPKDEHLARIGLADLALDTRICNGHTTTSDALWAGVPVITLQGGHFASRVSSSILTAVGLPELITHTLEEYESLAVRLSRNRDELHSIRQRLAKNRLTEPLFDTPRFAKNLEKAYKKMWEIFLAGEKPRKIEVVENQTQ
jgi:protein O-GlcNAc transferase